LAAAASRACAYRDYLFKEPAQNHVRVKQETTGEKINMEVKRANTSLLPRAGDTGICGRGHAIARWKPGALLIYDTFRIGSRETVNESFRGRFLRFILALAEKPMRSLPTRLRFDS
jgi:hypothetical protein